MMSDVLYFFTTTLNLGNILSCAAVYPPSFYGSTPFLYPKSRLKVTLEFYGLTFS